MQAKAALSKLQHSVVSESPETNDSATTAHSQ